jgi:F-type H+-transporting ATPase subunit epsilon
MKLKVLIPTTVLLDEEASKVSAEAENGSFTLQPHHIDFTAALVPGILSYESESGEEFFVAIDEGILVKCGAQVLVSVRQGVRGVDLETLEQTVAEKFVRLDEREKETRSAIAHLEVGLIRGTYEMGQ